MGVEPTPSAWKAPILAAIRYLQKFSFLLYKYYTADLSENQIFDRPNFLVARLLRLSLFYSSLLPQATYSCCSYKIGGSLTG